MRAPLTGSVFSIALLCVLPLAAVAGAERINHAGRILGPLPVVTTPLLFNTAQADAVVSAMQIMPRDSAWNEVISGRPVHTDSVAIMARIRADLVAINANRNRLRVFTEMNYVLVPDSQALVGMRFIDYPDDSDFNGGTNPVATWPIPSTMPIESWPSGRPAGETLTQWQQDTAGDGGDRHSVVVQPGVGKLFETWQAKLTTASPVWQASNGAIFTLNANTLRPAGWTSGDAAGLPLFPALIRYDECQRGVIEHALRIVVNKSRKEYIYPATHYASSIPATSTQYPAMGQRVRLRGGYTIPAGWSRESKAVAVALQTYGALVADNGGFFSVSVCPDERFAVGCFDDVQGIDINQFEVVSTTGPTGGPRAPGAPTANAGADQTVTLAAGATLAGAATGTGTTVTWSLYAPASAPAPGTATIAAPTTLGSTVSFSAPGVYTLLLRVADGSHTPAYDAVAITVLGAVGDNPVPILSSLTPSSAATGAGALIIVISGANFVAGSTVTWTGKAALTPTATAPGQLTISVPASYLSADGTPQLRVVNPAPGGGTSLPLTFPISHASTGGGSGGGASSDGGGGGCGVGAGLAALMALALCRWRSSLA